MITQMRVKGLIFDPYNNAYIVVLRDEENSDMLPIWVGKSEASAIGLALESVTAPRPMTHDGSENQKPVPSALRWRVSPHRVP